MEEDKSRSGEESTQQISKKRRSNMMKRTAIDPSNVLETKRNRAQNKLAYDLHYHPMDDTLRPSRAAKRRSVHGEQLLSSDVDDDDDDADATPSHADTDSGQPDQSESEESDKENSKKRKKTVTKTRKSSAGKLQAQVPSRRSSRKTSHPETAYRTDIHPQDRNLRETSDEDEDSPKSSRKRTKLSSNPARSSAAPSEELSDGIPNNPSPDSIFDMEDGEVAGTGVSDGKSALIPSTPAG